MSEQQIEQVLQMLEGCLNFLTGMQFDPSLGAEQKRALARKAIEIESLLNTLDL